MLGFLKKNNIQKVVVLSPIGKKIKIETYVGGNRKSSLTSKYGETSKKMKTIRSTIAKDLGLKRRSRVALNTEKLKESGGNFFAKHPMSVSLLVGPVGYITSADFQMRLPYLALQYKYHFLRPFYGVARLGANEIKGDAIVNDINRDIEVRLFSLSVGAGYALEFASSWRFYVDLALGYYTGQYKEGFGDGAEGVDTSSIAQIDKAVRNPMVQLMTGVDYALFWRMSVGAYISMQYFHDANSEGKVEPIPALGGGLNVSYHF